MFDFFWKKWNELFTITDCENTATPSDKDEASDREEPWTTDEEDNDSIQTSSSKSSNTSNFSIPHNFGKRYRR